MSIDAPTAAPAVIRKSRRVVFDILWSLLAFHEIRGPRQIAGTAVCMRDAARCAARVLRHQTGNANA
ncbi:MULTISPECIES: hypothetical protein [unclassified Burkholderia]|uniref:hypothetical protein n=1 Tax=unclassified Burkholderia TaxID=2613784 RepID=UPI00141E10F5|nr:MULTISPECIES: hypothetical protein [unclassified Burkholderia]